MRHGIVVANIGSFAEPATVVEMAKLAERSGWDAFFVWDHLGYVWEAPCSDPWVVLAAIAASGSGMTLGTAVTPVARYRPQRLAVTLTSLSRLHMAGLVFGAGLGGIPGEFAAFGEPADLRERGERLDEGLEVLSELLSGREVEHRGRFFTVDGVTLSPVPAAKIPFWIGGNSRAALARAARWDGWIADSTDAVEMTMEPAEFAHSAARIRSLRKHDGPFELVIEGYSTPDDLALVNGYELAGATLWLEAVHDIRGPLDEMMARVKAGPALAAKS